MLQRPRAAHRACGGAARAHRGPSSASASSRASSSGPCDALATASGTSRLGVRTRPGSTPESVVVAFVWRRRGRGRGPGRARSAPPWAALAGRRRRRGSTGRGDHPAPPPASARRAGADASRSPRSPAPTARRRPPACWRHIGMTAGLKTAWCSTDGIVVQGEMVEPGDYSGPAGARAVLVDARGRSSASSRPPAAGMLLKGMGVAANDVSVVTNVSADHLGPAGHRHRRPARRGQGDRHPGDQAGRAGSCSTARTRGSGPCGPAPGPGRGCSRLDADSPAVREALDAGGRAITVLDGDITVLAPDGDPDRLVSVVDVPVTLSGLSAAQHRQRPRRRRPRPSGLGLPREAVVEGLRTFAPDDAAQPGPDEHLLRARRPAGARHGHRRPGPQRGRPRGAAGRRRSGLRPAGGGCTSAWAPAGDRTDEILQSIGEIAGLRADRVVAAHKEHYLRGRSMDDLEAPAAHRPGAGRGRRTSSPTRPSSRACRRWWPTPATATSWP